MLNVLIILKFFSGWMCSSLLDGRLLTRDGRAFAILTRRSRFIVWGLSTAIVKATSRPSSCWCRPSPVDRLTK